MPSKSSLTPRKKPQQSRSQKTVARILDAAARILEEQGLAGFNTNAVAEAAGISIGSLYQYFPSKDAMTAMLIQQHMSAFLHDLKAVTTRSDCSFDRQIRRLVAIAVAQQLERPQLARILDMEEARLPLHEDIAAMRAEIWGLVSSTIALGGFKDVKTLTQDVTAIAQGTIDTAGSVGEGDPKQLEERVCRAIFGYLDRCEHDNGMTSQPLEDIE